MKSRRNTGFFEVEHHPDTVPAVERIHFSFIIEIVNSIRLFLIMVYFLALLIFH